MSTNVLPSGSSGSSCSSCPSHRLLPSRSPAASCLPLAGNTCFFNAALQCLRYTPGLPLQVVPDLLQLAEQRRQPGKAAAKSVSFAAGPPAVAAAACAGGSACSASGGEAAEEESGLEEQPSLDVHQQALARASCELPPEAVEAARRELEAVSSGVDCDAAAAAAAASGPGAAGAEGARTAAEAGSEAAAGEAAASGVASEQQAQQQLNGPAAAAAPPAPAPAAAAPAAPAAQPGKPQRPPKGALLEAFATLVKDLYLQPENGDPTACAAPLLRTLRAFPIAGALVGSSGAGWAVQHLDWWHGRDPACGWQCSAGAMFLAGLNINSLPPPVLQPIPVLHPLPCLRHCSRLL